MPVEEAERVVRQSLHISGRKIAAEEAFSPRRLNDKCNKVFDV
jgi:hypothetical protein